MDISKAPNDKKLELCRTYFRTGFLVLPFVWVINAVWFYGEGFRKPAYPEQEQIKKYVILSAIGAFIWFILLTVWIIIFQTNRAEWGAIADYISFIIPLGKA